ncbi:MAG: hypothetical protein PVH77_00545 [Phycisphaerales bacterium]|jgi:hypothetical protein
MVFVVDGAVFGDLGAVVKILESLLFLSYLFHLPYMPVAAGMVHLFAC